MAIAKVLVVDDEESVRAMLRLVLRREGYEVSEAADGLSGVEIARQVRPDVIMMDVRMPRMDGMAALRVVRKERINATVILMTAFAAVESAVQAMKSGAYDYIIKPFNIDEVKILLGRVMESRRLEAEANLLRRELCSHYQLGQTLTRSPKMRAVYDAVAKVAPTQATVLITGESGTGKELLVSMIHYNSPRASGPFVKVNCSALPEMLLESELFGHERGAFTSALARRLGRFELADKGTLFLDEIGEMPSAVQVKLLRVLQEREFERVGSSHTVKTDIRIVAATNRTVSDLFGQGKFRGDLYYRLAVVTLEIPPLRERKEDIPLLARLFLQRFAQETGRELDDFDPETMDILEAYHWPGNVRELSNVVERAVIMSTGRILFPEDLPSHLFKASTATRSEEAELWQGKTLRDILKETESNIIRQVLGRNGGNRMKTARDLVMSRRALQYKIEEYGLAAEGHESVREV
jgi:two-component system, NtrC family, response regulator AtoC